MKFTATESLILICKMKKLGINFENVLSVMEEFNIGATEALNKLKNVGITSLDVKYERLVENNLYLKDILISGLNIESIFSFCPFHELNNVQKALKMVDFAFENRIKEIMFISEIKATPYLKEDIISVKKNLRRVVKYASAFGVSIGIENVGNKNYPCKAIEDTLDILKSVKGLKLVFDGGNFMLNEVRPIEAIKSLAPYVQRYHIKDRKLCNSSSDFNEITTYGNSSFVAVAGTGDSDCLEVYNMIKKYYNEVPIVLEFPALEKNLFDKIEKSAMYVYTEMM